MSYKNKIVSVVIVAAGLGKRMGSKINKQFILLEGRPVLAHTIEKFNSCEYIDEIIVVTRENEIEYCNKEIVEKYNYTKVKKITSGGKERQDSVYNGLKSVQDNTNIVLIHDGARPFIKNEDIVKGIKSVLCYGPCVLGTPVKDTIKIVNKEKDIIDTPDRGKLWAVQTPQFFPYEVILKAYEKFKDKGFKATDDSMLVERLGYKVKIVQGSYENIKLTTPEDLRFAEAIIEENKYTDK